MSGVDTADASACSQCKSNCRPSNYTAGENGQFISLLCTYGNSTATNGTNLCSACSGSCQSYLARPPAGEYIVGFCSGTTQTDRQCASCRISCPAGQYIAGTPCSGESASDTTYCADCPPKPTGYAAFTRNPCTGSTREPQVWEACQLSCPAGQYVSAECTATSPTQCSACRTSCQSGYYLSGTCDGTTKYDSTQCLPCKDCASGQFRGNLAACNGTTSADTVVCTACRSACPAGQYIFGTCGGKMGFDETSCKECTVCQRDRPGLVVFFSFF